ncbi:MAG: hypothetical protein SFY66_27680 [Oculatellaceae cyanobacterium bins.114]|nr:hypothetical protein [Oculatellaceae cyanobacterium bins.114]
MMTSFVWISDLQVGNTKLRYLNNSQLWLNFICLEGCLGSIFWIADQMYEFCQGVLSAVSCLNLPYDR